MDWKRKEAVETQLEERLIHTEEGDIPYLVFPGLESLTFLEHAVSTRMGGVSEGIFSSMNFSLSRGDDLGNVRENYRRFALTVHAVPEDLVCTDQTHTTNILKVTEKDRGKGYLKERDYSDIDGLITDEPGLVLSCFFADCVPLLFADPVKKVIGVAHSGWRGTLAGMGREMVQRMNREYGCDPKDLRAGIGPSICQKCYEVGPEVAEPFIERLGKDDRLAYRKENGKYQLNLWEANRLILTGAGIPEKNIEITDICTCCNPGLLFSHRASRGKRGILTAFMKIR